MFDVSHPVTGENFIGREEELRYIKNQIFDAAIRRITINVSLTGSNRIGKTSLIREACRRFDEKPHPNTYVISLSLEGSGGFWKFWAMKAVTALFKIIKLDELKQQGEFVEEYVADLLELKGYFERRDVLSRLFADDPVEHEIAKDKFETIFGILKQCNVFIILIIDEFDLANRVFGKHEENFDWLRGLLQQEYYLSAVTISRRELYYIENSAFGGSTLHGTFVKYGLYGFRNSELSTYFDVLEKEGRPLNEAQRAEVVYYCGRSPYYLAIIGNSIIQAATPIPPIQQLFEQRSRLYYDSFDATIKILKEEGLLQAMLQMFIGPNYSLKEEDVSRLVGMGYCLRKNQLHGSQDENGFEDIYKTYEEHSQYLTVCNSFIDYLASVKEKDVEAIYPKLHKVERGLREITREALITLYKDKWKEHLLVISNECLRQKKNGESRIENRDRFYRQYISQHQRAGSPDALDDSLLHVINFTDLGDIIIRIWNRVKNIFRVDKSEFSSWMIKIQDIRNPYAHSNPEVVSHVQMTEVDKIMEKILRLLDSKSNN